MWITGLGEVYWVFEVKTDSKVEGAKRLRIIVVWQSKVTTS